MKFTSLVLAAALASPLAMAATDQHQENLATRQYVGGAVSYVDVDDDRQIDDQGEGYSVFYGRQLSDSFWWETEGGFYKMDGEVPDGQDFYQYHLTTGLAYAFGDRTGFTPYVIVALGAIKHEVLPRDDNDTNFTANAGLGAVTGPIFDNGLKLRGDVRYVYDDFDGAGPARGEGGFGDVRASLGLEFPLGYTKVITKEKTVVKTREVAVQQPVIDSDGDGIPDNLDQCPNTLPGGKVDAKGCLIVNQTITFNDILFELDSARLTRSSENTLSRIAQSLQSQTDFRIEVAGHTDSTGSAEYNDILSQKRADSVRQYLISQGVDSGRISARGYGESDPVAGNDSVSGRAMNRRVEFRVTEK
ncbi:OmpA family protein [Alloalcanivorax mobilis]|uniref:OmpA family protein n=1 Tax=Alloalcanivorax mobilis TaxID=2019569 RepID=UPI001E5C12C9|nr:OmpA family protein [Alloalcanivorax mobilis]